MPCATHPLPKLDVVSLTLIGVLYEGPPTEHTDCTLLNTEDLRQGRAGEGMLCASLNLFQKETVNRLIGRGKYVDSTGRQHFWDYWRWAKSRCGRHIYSTVVAIRGRVGAILGLLQE